MPLFVRSKFSVSTLLILILAEDKYPTQSALETYAATLGLTHRQVQGWFAQKRRRNKREDETTVSSIGNEHSLSRRNGSNLSQTGRILNSKSNSKTMAEGNIVNRRKRLGSIQTLFSSDYILMKVFGKDGPPVGAGFDCLSSGAFLHCKGILQVTSSCLFP